MRQQREGKIHKLERELRDTEMRSLEGAVVEPDPEPDPEPDGPEKVFEITLNLVYNTLTEINLTPDRNAHYYLVFSDTITGFDVEFKKTTISPLLSEVWYGLRQTSQVNPRTQDSIEVTLQQGGFSRTLSITRSANDKIEVSVDDDNFDPMPLQIWKIP